MTEKDAEMAKVEQAAAVKKSGTSAALPMVEAVADPEVLTFSDTSGLHEYMPLSEAEKLMQSGKLYIVGVIRGGK